MPRSSPYEILLSDRERAELDSRAPVYVAIRAKWFGPRIVLLAANGLRNDEIAAGVDTPRRVVSE